jgi:hypothetical protein
VPADHGLMRRSIPAALALAGVVLMLSSACGSGKATADTAATNQPAPTTTRAVVHVDTTKKIVVDLAITGDFTENVTGTTGVCDPERYSFQASDLKAATDFTFEVQIDSAPKLALNTLGQSYLTFAKGAEGTFTIAANLVTLDVDVHNFKNGMVHLKGTLACQS